MRVFLILAFFLVTAGAAIAGPEEDASAATAAYWRGDYATAMRLYRRAADQGHGDAANNLGGMHFRGTGVPYDDAEAAKWFLRGAELGNATAQKNIGNAYRFGQGVPKNEIAALMWFNLAVARGNRSATEDRDAVAREMTAAQVAEAQKLADEWKPKR